MFSPVCIVSLNICGPYLMHSKPFVLYLCHAEVIRIINIVRTFYRLGGIN